MPIWCSNPRLAARRCICSLRVDASAPHIGTGDRLRRLDEARAGGAHRRRGLPVRRHALHARRPVRAVPRPRPPVPVRLVQAAAARARALPRRAVAVTGGGGGGGGGGGRAGAGAGGGAAALRASEPWLLVPRRGGARHQDRRAARPRRRRGGVLRRGRRLPARGLLDLCACRRERGARRVLLLLGGDQGRRAGQRDQRPRGRAARGVRLHRPLRVLVPQRLDDG